MSFAKMNGGASEAQRAALRDHLVEEWALQQEGLVEPIIIEEPVRPYTDLLRLYVIWSDWSGISQRERSKIIMESYKISHPDLPANVPAITVAMGLTPEEAQRMGIEYAPLEDATLESAA